MLKNRRRERTRVKSQESVTVSGIVSRLSVVRDSNGGV